MKQSMIGQPAPLTRLDTWLAGLDGPVLAGIVVLTFVALCVIATIPSILARCARSEAPRIPMPRPDLDGNVEAFGRQGKDALR